MKLGWSSGTLRDSHGAGSFISRILPFVLGSGNWTPDRQGSECGTIAMRQDFSSHVCLKQQKNHRLCSQRGPSALTSELSWEMLVCPDLLPLLFPLKAFRSPREDGHERSLGKEIF